MKTITLTLLGILLGYAATATAATTGKALIIGIESYEKATTLAYVENDVSRLAKALSDRCGYDVTMVLNSAITTRRTTHRDAMMKQIEDWITSVQPTDNAVLYFSGHGFLGSNQELYLAALDCDPNNPVPGGIPIAWLKEQLDRCKSTSKFLLLDACHSGNTKGNAMRSASAKSIVVEFAGVKGTTTFASCQGDENSYLWNMKQQSLFTFWLTRGIEGHADNDGDGEVNLDELTEFVTDNVSTIAQRQLNRRQTPTLVGDTVNTEDLVFANKPLTLKTLIADMADQIDTQLRCENFSSVGVVPSFTCGQVASDLSLDFGLLPTFIASQLRMQLMKASRSDYRIVSENAMREALRDAEAGIQDVGASKTRSLVAKGGEQRLAIPAIVSGRVLSRDRQIIGISCTLVDASGMADIAVAGGNAFLNESERAMIPDSVSMLAQIESEAEEAPPVPREDQQLTSSFSSADDSDLSPEQLQRQYEIYDAEAKRQHPLLDPKFPFQLAILARDGASRTAKLQRRKLNFEGNKGFVRLQRGEVYEVYVKNHSDKPVWLRLMVDGLNTLAQKTGVIDRGAETIAASLGEFTVAPRVSLADARAWRVEPGTIYGLRGFYEPGDITYREFKVVDATQSAAAKMNFTENIGLITAAFYEEAEAVTQMAADDKQPKATANLNEVAVTELPGGFTARGIKIGTDFGATQEEKLEHYEGEGKLGRLLAVVHLQYQE
jgi:hypothetical protein